MSTEDVWYLAGPMSGIPQFNFPAFYAATEELRSAGYTVVSPAELDDAEDSGAAMQSPDGNPANAKRSWGDFLARDVKIIADTCTGVVFLPGWATSRGARLEAFVGLLAGHKFGLYGEYGRIMPCSPGWVMDRIYDQSFPNTGEAA